MSFEKGTYKSSVHVVIRPNEGSTIDRTDPSVVGAATYDQRFAQDPPGAPGHPTQYRKFSDSTTPKSPQEAHDTRMRSTSVVVAPSSGLTQDTKPEGHSPKYARTFTGGEVTMQINLQGSAPIISGGFHDPPINQYSPTATQFSIQERATPRYSAPPPMSAQPPVIKPYNPSKAGLTDRNQNVMPSSVLSKMAVFEKKSTNDVTPPTPKSVPWNGRTPPPTVERPVLQTLAPKADIVEVAKPSQITIKYPTKETRKLGSPEPKLVHSAHLATLTEEKPKSERVQPRLSDLKQKSLDLPQKDWKSNSNGDQEKKPATVRIPGRQSTQEDIKRRWTGKTNLKQKDKGRRKLTGINSPLAHNFRDIKNVFSGEETSPESSFSRRNPDSILEADEPLRAKSTDSFDSSASPRSQLTSPLQADNKSITGSSSSLSSDGLLAETVRPKIMVPSRRFSSERLNGAVKPEVTSREIHRPVPQERLQLISSSRSPSNSSTSVDSDKDSAKSSKSSTRGESLHTEKTKREIHEVEDETPAPATTSEPVEPVPAEPVEPVPAEPVQPVPTEPIKPIPSEPVQPPSPEPVPAEPVPAEPVQQLPEASPDVNPGSSFFVEEEDEFERLRKLRERRFSKTRSSARGRLQLGASLDVQDIQQRKPILQHSQSEDATVISKEDKQIADKVESEAPSAPARPTSPAPAHAAPRRASESAPCFIVKPRRQSAIEGGDVKFRASVHADPEPKVQWLCNGVSADDNPRCKILENNGYHFLEFKDVSTVDAGTITCLVSNTVGETQVQADLEVIEKPNRTSAPKQLAPVLSEGLDDLEVAEEGQLVTLSCAVNGKPEPDIAWFHNRQRLTTTECRQRYDGEVARLTIKSFKSKYVGEFKCTASNSLGSIESSCQVSLKAEKRAPQIIEEMSDISVRDGCSGALSCKLNATADTEITWYRNDKVVKASRDFKPSFDGFVAKLEITEVYPEDAGVYVCKAVNSSGESSSTAQVSVQDVEPVQMHLTPAPAIVQKTAPVFTQGLLDCTVDEGASVEFEIRISGSAPIQISWFHNSKAIKSNDPNYKVTSNGDLHKLIIPNATAALKGTYVCEACNEYGDEESPCELTVLDELVKASTTPYFVQKPTSLHVDEGTSALFSCQAHGVPPPLIQWQLNGCDLASDERIKLSENGELSTLEIPHALSSDAGKYICIASNSAGKEMSTFSLIIKQKRKDESISDFRSVLKSRSSTKEANTTATSGAKQLDFRNVLKNKTPKKPTCLQALKDCSVNEGDDIRLQCKFTESPSAAQWKFNNQDVKDSESSVLSLLQGVASLTISSATVSAQGHYTCTASNEGGSTTSSCEVKVEAALKPKPSADLIPTTSMTTSLMEMEEPPFIEDLSPENIHIIRRQSFSLVASFVASPAPDVAWFRDRVQLADGGRIRIENKKKQSVLHVDCAEGDDTGCYTLQLTNELGSDRVSSSVTVEDKPEPPVGQPAISNITGTSLVLSWSGPSYDGGSSITGYKVEMAEKSAEWQTISETCRNTTFEVSDLLPNKEYEFRVSVGNQHGFSDPGLPSEVAITIDGRNSKLECISASASDLLSPIILSGPLSPLALMSARDEESDDEPLSPFDELAFEPRQVELDTTRNFTDFYTTGGEIGKGRFGSVFLCKEKQSNREFAAKFIKVKMGQRDELRNEVMIMNALHHPKLLLLWDAFETRREMVLIMEHVAGGELFERIIDEDYILTERESIHFMRQIVSGVHYMHENNILHLDLKPENILCISKNSNEIKIIDFGLARKYDPTKSAKVMFGTAEFVAPEVVNYDPISYTTDMWSVGVICYMLLSGLSPFMGENDAETFVNVTLTKWDFDDDIFDDISDDAKEFIETLLMLDPRKRQSASEALQHKWLSQDVKFMRAKRLSTEKHKRYMAKRKWQKTGNAMRALGRMSILQKTLDTGRNSPSTRSRASSINSDSSSSSNSTDARNRKFFPTLSKKTCDLSDDAVLREPKFTTKMSDLEVTTGQTATFKVKVEGQPEPSITWFKENEPIKGDRRRVIGQLNGGEHTLTIHRCLSNDDAEYRCQATNTEGVAMSRADLFVDPEKQS